MVFASQLHAFVFPRDRTTVCLEPEERWQGGSSLEKAGGQGLVGAHVPGRCGKTKGLRAAVERAASARTRSNCSVLSGHVGCRAGTSWHSRVCPRAGVLYGVNACKGGEQAPLPRDSTCLQD